MRVNFKTRVRIVDLLGVLKKNRANHHKLYLEAKEGYIEAARRAIGAKLDALLSGRAESLVFTLVVPEDHTSNYDTVIGMLEMTQDEEIELSADEFRTYVQDEWDWMRGWALSNSTYCSGVMDFAESKKYI